jgi:hypothetical protein
VNIIAKPYPLGAQPFVVSKPANCRYPWCQHPAFEMEEVAVHARATAFNTLPGSTLNYVTGNMHVSHTTLADRYNGGVTEYHDDGTDDPGGQIVNPVMAQPAYLQSHEIVNPMTAPQVNSLEDIVASVPTDTIYVSNVEDLIKRLDVNEVLIIKRASGSAHRRRVNVWRRMP